MSKEYTVPKTLQCNFNGSIMSFRPKPQYKTDSQNCISKINYLIKPNFQNIKNKQLERQNQNQYNHQNQQVFNFKYHNPVKIQTPVQRNHLNTSYYRTIQQTQKNNLHLEKSIIQKRHQSQLQKFLVKQNQNLMNHRDFLTTQVRKYRTKAKNYRHKYYQQKQKVKILQQDIQIWKYKFQQMKAFVYTSQANNIKKSKGFQSTGVYLSNVQTQNGLKTGSFYGQNNNYLKVSKAQMSQSRYCQETERYSQESNIIELNDQFQATMYDYKIRKDEASKQKCTQIAKQILNSEAKRKIILNNKQNNVRDPYNNKIFQKAYKFLQEQSIIQIQQNDEKDKPKKRKELGQITQQQNNFRQSDQSF